MVTPWSSTATALPAAKISATARRPVQPTPSGTRTAASSTASGVPPAELTNEQDFDPRSLLRYLIAFEPDTRSAPHLLDDTLLVHLAVDHADQLSALYGRSLQLRLRRTDPPPGSLATAAHPTDEPFTLVWVPLFDEFRPEGQRRVLEAIREAPCLEEPNLGGTTGENLGHEQGRGGCREDDQQCDFSLNSKRHVQSLI